MNRIDPLIHTKLRLPFTRSGLVSRPRLQERIAQGLRGPLTLITAPPGFGKTTLAASSATDCGMPVAWLSLDKDDNQVGRFLSYLLAALQEADVTLGSGAAQLLATSQQTPQEAILTSLINDLDSTGEEIALVLDDYQFISSQAVHSAVVFLLEHCPRTFHLVIASRSDPALPLARLRARGQMVELRVVDLSFSEPEAAQFLNEVMGLHLDAGSIARLAERTEGWVAGLQMAALSIRDREDVREFIEGFSGTNRYILDYLLEEVLSSQPPEFQRFLLYTSILERLNAPLCEAVLEDEKLKSWQDDRLPETSQSAYLSTFQPTNLLSCQQMLESLERANLFLMPLDEERIWYRYHHLFADLLRAQLHRTLGSQGIAQLHIRASKWHAQNGSILEAIQHASRASDDGRVERLIDQNYMEMMSRGELSWMRFWTGELSRELIYNRPWLCIYEAQSHAWFGELDEADRLLEEAEKHNGPEVATPEARAMLGHLAYIRSRITAMRGDNQQAISLCLSARELTPAENLAMQLDINMTLGYEYFLDGDYANASPILLEAIRSYTTAGAIINPVAASCVLARMHAVQGQLNNSDDLYQSAVRLITEASGQHRGAKALVEVGMAEVYYERNDLDSALAHLQLGLTLMPWWGKADDFVLAYITQARIHLARGNRTEAIEAIDKVVQMVQTRSVFSEARDAIERAKVNLWLAQGNLATASHWAASLEERFSSDGRFGFENELAQITRAHVLLAQHKPNEAAGLCLHLEETARSAGRMGRAIEILLLEALAWQETGNAEESFLALTECLALAQPEGYMRIFLDEGEPMKKLLAQWLAYEQVHRAAQAETDALRNYASHLLSQFNLEPHGAAAAEEKVPAAGGLVDPLSQRELEVLHLIALGKTNQEIARQLFVSPGTIKAHTASIYRKLDVANRTEATARARQLRILN